MERRVAVLAIAALAGCRGVDREVRCVGLVERLGALGSFRVRPGVPADVALRFGQACGRFEDEDFACVARAETEVEARLCDGMWQHATQGAVAFGSHPAGPQPDREILEQLGEAVCACDAVRCLVGIGHRLRPLYVRIEASGWSDDPATQEALERYSGCLDTFDKLH